MHKAGDGNPSEGLRRNNIPVRKELVQALGEEWVRLSEGTRTMRSVKLSVTDTPRAPGCLLLTRSIGGSRCLCADSHFRPPRSERQRLQHAPLTGHAFPLQSWL